MEITSFWTAQQIAIRERGQRVKATWDPDRQRHYKEDGSEVDCLSMPTSECIYLMGQVEADHYLAAYDEYKAKVASGA